MAAPIIEASDKPKEGARARGALLARLKSSAIQSIPAIVFTAIAVGVWQGVVWMEWAPDYLFPGPLAVLRSLIEMARDGMLWESIKQSMIRLAIGYGLSVAGGLALGALCARSKIFQAACGGLILSLQSLPSVCWLPLALIWLGLNEKAVLAVVILGSVFAISISTEGALRNVPPIYGKVGRVLGARGWRLTRDVLFFAALPEIVGGLKLGWSFAWRSLMAAELIRQDLFGVGRLLETGRQFNDAAMMLAAMGVILAIGLVMDRAVFGTIERSIRRRWGLTG